MTQPTDYLSKVLKQQQDLLKSINPLPDIIGRYDHLLGIANQFNLTGITEGLNSLSHIQDILSSYGVSQSYLALQEQIENSLSSLSSFSTELHYLSSSAAFASIIANQEKLYSAQDEFYKYAHLLELPSTRVESVLASAEAASRLWNADSFFSEFTLSSISQYQSFAAKQFAQLASDTDSVAERRLEVTELSGDLFESINASVEIGAVIEEKVQKEQPKVKSHQNIDSENSIYGHINQHLGFVYRRTFKGNCEDRFRESLPAVIVNLGSTIIEKIFQINSIVENSGKKAFFKPTTQTMRACGLIPSLVSTNEIEFNSVIDYLYFLIYEGSGSAKRLLTVSTDSSLSPLWKIKHLRLAARHDIDHGKGSDIKKKRKKIYDTYHSLINQPLPIKQKDWQKAQIAIYSEVNIMLHEILCSLASQNG